MDKTALDQELQDKINRVVEILKKTVNGECALALAGAHAKGVADKSSDIDIFLFTDHPKSFEERERILREAADPGTSPWISATLDYPWGGSMDFSYEGTPVEVVVRTFQLMDKRLKECLNGQFEIIPQTWTSNGYYTFTYLSELSFIKPIWDPKGLLQRYQDYIKPYPSKLKASIMDCFFDRANTWINNFHYQSAIKRLDILFTGPIVLHTVLDMIQVIFAINEEYFPGDKKLEAALTKLSYCPQELLDNMEVLLCASRNQDQLQTQCDILRRVMKDIEAKMELCREGSI